MGREMRRAQERAQRRQQQRVRQQRAQPPPTSVASPASEGRRGSFFKPRWALDIISELRKVTWPSRGDVRSLTVVVIIVALLLGAVLGAADLAFSWVVEQTILR
jgi:preprotein translocase subunit SecE